MLAVSIGPYRVVVERRPSAVSSPLPPVRPDLVDRAWSREQILRTVELERRQQKKNYLLSSHK